MTRLLSYPDELLRGRLWWAHGGSTRTRLVQLAAMLVLFGFFYGMVMGCYGGFDRGRWLQVLYSGLKVPILLMSTFAISLPSFFVVNTLFGLRKDFAHAVRALVAAQAGLTIVLASCAPLTVFWYASFENYNGAILFNAVMFGGASLAAQLILRNFYSPLIERDPRHRLLQRAWLTIYAFVGVQMGWILRPFIGDPSSPVSFFRDEAWGNGYVALFHTIRRLIAGS